MSMNDSAQVNQVYLIFNRPQFLVDSSDLKYLIDINTTIAIGEAGGNRVLCFINHPRLSHYIR